MTTCLREANEFISLNLQAGGWGDCYCVAFPVAGVNDSLLHALAPRYSVLSCKRTFSRNPYRFAGNTQRYAQNYGNPDHVSKILKSRQPQTYSRGAYDRDVVAFQLVPVPLSVQASGGGLGMMVITEVESQHERPPPDLSCDRLVSFFPNLTNIRVNLSQLSDEEACDLDLTLLKKLPYLRSVSFHFPPRSRHLCEQVAQLPQVRDVAVKSNSEMKVFGDDPLSRTLRKFSLVATPVSHTLKLLRNCTKLEHLQLEECNFVTNSGLSDLRHLAGSLRCLRFRPNVEQSFSPDVFFASTAHLRYLQELSLCPGGDYREVANFAVTDAHLELIAQSIPTLEIFCLESNKNRGGKSEISITSEGIASICSLPCLRELTIFLMISQTAIQKNERVDFSQVADCSSANTNVVTTSATAAAAASHNDNNNNDNNNTNNKASGAACTSLQVLRFYLPKIDDAIISQIPVAFPNLRHLELTTTGGARTHPSLYDGLTDLSPLGDLGGSLEALLGFGVLTASKITKGGWKFLADLKRVHTLHLPVGFELKAPGSVKSLPSHLQFLYTMKQLRNLRISPSFSAKKKETHVLLAMMEYNLPNLSMLNDVEFSSYLTIVRDYRTLVAEQSRQEVERHRRLREGEGDGVSVEDFSPGPFANFPSPSDFVPPTTAQAAAAAAATGSKTN